MRSPGHPTPMPRAPLFARSLSAFRPGNLVNFAFKKLKVQHKRFQIVSNPRRHRSNNPFSKARKTCLAPGFEVLQNPRTRIDESKPWLLAQPLWPWTPKRNVPSHYTGIWNEDTSMVTLSKKGTGWIHAILFGQVRRSNGLTLLKRKHKWRQEKCTNDSKRPRITASCTSELALSAALRILSACWNTKYQRFAKPFAVHCNIMYHLVTSNPSGVHLALNSVFLFLQCFNLFTVFTWHVHVTGVDFKSKAI